MPASATYRLFERAMEERRHVACVYRGRKRALQPVVLGWSDGREKVLAYQTGGASSRPLTTPDGRWRCLLLGDVEAPMLQDGWTEIDTSHRSGQSCVRDVDLDVNPDSPFHPRRRLRWQVRR
jgi:hypothetical protein